MVPIDEKRNMKLEELFRKTKIEGATHEILFL
jgi:hypothetical protein